MAEDLTTNETGILRGVQVVEGTDTLLVPLGVDDYLKAWALKTGELEQLLFTPHAWLRTAAPDWYSGLAPTDQITVIFSYPVLPQIDTVTPYVEVVKERPLVTVRCPPDSAIIQDLRSKVTSDPAGKLDLVIYKDAHLAYGHYEISDVQGEIQKVILALVADPKTYINAIGAANTNPKLTFQAAEQVQEIRCICQFKSTPTMSLDETPELPGCTMFTGTYSPDDTDPDSGTVFVDTVWAADWPPQPVPDPPQPTPDPTPAPQPDPTPPDPPQPDPSP